ncbi:MAG: FAD-dependent oxidoreductase [Phycisphaeraceae bacterium]|nr:MAG: FAD-dependent oxidoreductase [Phycisphaeraceae bacterium]
MRERFFDIAIVGTGPAGLAAASEAVRAGRSVAVIDESPGVGGQVWRGSGGGEAARWRTKAEDATFLLGAAVYDAAPGRLLVNTPDGAVCVRAGAIVLATGARELLLPFPGWTLPGVMGAGGVQSMVKSGMRVEGKRVVIAGSGPLLWAVAATLRSRGADVLGIAEQAPGKAVRALAASLWRSPAKAVQAATLAWQTRGVPKWTGSWPVRAEGLGRLERVTLSDGERTMTLECDLLGVGFGLVPNTTLASLLGCRVQPAVVGGAVAVDAAMGTTVAGVYAAGEAVGIGGVDCAILEGRIAGLAAAGSGERAMALSPARVRARAFAARLESAFTLRPEVLALADERTILCRCEDVPFGEVVGLGSWREAKVHTRCGMGPCQGRVCGSALAAIKGWTPNDARPPIVPVPVSVLMDQPAATAADHPPKPDGAAV